MTTEKHCSKCETTKAAAEFYTNLGRPDGLSSYCRKCQIADAQSRYTKHPRWKAPEGMKKCPKCGEIKSLDDFGSNRSAHDGKQQYCKPCSSAIVTASRQRRPEAHRASSKRWREKNLERHADNNAKRNYGVEHGTYAKMFEAQNGLCAICEQPPKNDQRFHIDHCHDTSRVRELLCSKCNTGIGQMNHDPEIVLRAHAYLLKHR